MLQHFRNFVATIKRLYNNFRYKYFVLFLLIVVGIIALIYSDIPDPENHRTLCLFHNITGYPCPGCGVGRGIIFILKGYFTKALWMNPLSFLVLLFGVVSVVWIWYDIIKGKETYLPMLKTGWGKKTQTALFIVLIANWVWNIYKGI